jgi:predicted Rossmann-fold nucleotide-binding protein
MAELTTLDEKLAEVLGLAQAAQTATKKVATLARKEKEAALLELMQQMGDEAAKVEQRCDVVAGSRDGMRTAITKKARETKGEVVGFMRTYLEDAEALDGLEFLSMAEAGEMAHWEILATLNETAQDKDVAGVVKFALPLQRTHVDAVREHSLRLAGEEDPSEPA